MKGIWFLFYLDFVSGLANLLLLKKKAFHNFFIVFSSHSGLEFPWYLEDAVLSFGTFGSMLLTFHGVLLSGCCTENDFFLNHGGPNPLLCVLLVTESTVSGVVSWSPLSFSAACLHQVSWPTLICELHLRGKKASCFYFLLSLMTADSSMGNKDTESRKRIGRWQREYCSG